MKNQNALDNRAFADATTTCLFQTSLLLEKEKIELLIDASKSDKIVAQQIVASARIALERKIKNLYAR